MWKFLKYGFLAWVPLSVVTAPLYWPYLRMIWVFNARVAPPDYDEPSSELEARRQDLDYLSTLTDYDRSFSDDARAGFSAALEALDARIDGLSEAGFYLAIAEAVALADNGHTNISYRPQYARFGTIGARLYEFEDGLYVVSAVSDEDHTVGRKVVRINGQPSEEARAALRRFRGGNEQWRDLYSTLILESPELFAAATGAGETTSVTLELESETGDREEVTFDAIAPADGFDPPSRSAWQTLVPGALPTGDAAWSHALEAEGAVLPRYLTAPDQALSYTMPSGGLYIRALPGFENTLFVFCSDHGEGLDDHPGVWKSQGHGLLLYESMIRVPLLFYWPGQLAPREVRHPVQMLDLMPTLLEAAGSAPPDQLEGTSLLPPLRGDRALAKTLPPFAVAETWRNRRDKTALSSSAFQRIHNRDFQAGCREYELQRIGPPANGKQTDMNWRHPDIAWAMDAHLRQWFDAHPKGTPVRVYDVTDDTQNRQEQLRALGYL